MFLHYFLRLIRKNIPVTFVTFLYHPGLFLGMGPELKLELELDLGIRVRVGFNVRIWVRIRLTQL